MSTVSNLMSKKPEIRMSHRSRRDVALLCLSFLACFCDHQEGLQGCPAQVGVSSTPEVI